MELVDPQGKRLTKRSRQEVLDILQELAPKNKEQERILAQAIGAQMEKARKNKMRVGLKEGFGGLFADNAKKRVTSDGYNKTRNWRLEAVIPREMFNVAREIWGEDVITNPVKFKEAFVKDEQGRMCLTVDPKTI